MGQGAVVLGDGEGAPRDEAGLRAELDALIARGVTRVELLGARPGPGLAELVAHAVVHGLVVRVEAAPDADAAALASTVRDAGAAVLAVPLRSPDGPGGRALAEEGPTGLRRVALVPVDADTAPRIGALIALCAAHAVDLELHGALRGLHPGPALAAAALRVALDAAWRACSEASVRVRFVGLAVPPGVPVPGAEPPVALHDSVVDVLRADLPLRSLEAGVLRGTDDAGEAAAQRVGGWGSLGRLLGAVGWPVHDLPRCMAGLGRGKASVRSQRCASCPGGEACTGLKRQEPELPAVAEGVGVGARIHVILPYVPDRLMVEAGLPGLARRLRELGAEVVLHSAWHAPANPHGVRQDAPIRLGEGARERDEHAAAGVKAFARGLDLSGADAVVAPGWAWAGLALRHPSLPPTARVVVADDHLLDGVEGWKKRYLPPGARSLVTPWWPDRRVHVHSAFPGYARMYWYAGVPLEQVWWRAYPLYLPAFPEGPPAATCTGVVAAGSHLRAHDALARAARAVPITVISRQRPPSSPGLAWQAELPLPAFHARLAASRFVVVSVRHDPERAAGLSVIAMAQAAGRPVVATATPGTLDHVRHEHDGLLVPADDLDALTAAVVRLHEDEDLLTRLAAGARRAAARGSVAAWAHGLVHGAPFATQPHPVSGAAPWRAW
ncbi:MAG: glycosyltransferase [Alphaproteobacteria bacterium]|nr:glycosyltransferase [Alphaproteobacteria bacterium]